MYNKWVYLGAHKGSIAKEGGLQQLTISHLLPNTIYKFKLFSFNNLANSTDITTDTVRSRRPASPQGESNHVKGVGNKVRQSERCKIVTTSSPNDRYPANKHSKFVHTKACELITLDDKTQRVIIKCEVRLMT